MGALAAILLLTGGLDALQNGAILTATPFAILMCLMCWCLYKTLRRDYREERQQIQEIMRRHEAGEAVGSAMPDSSNSGMRKGQPFRILPLSAFQHAAYGGLSARQLVAC